MLSCCNHGGDVCYGGPGVVAASLFIRLVSNCLQLKAFQFYSMSLFCISLVMYIHVFLLSCLKQQFQQFMSNVHRSLLSHINMIVAQSCTDELCVVWDLFSAQLNAGSPQKCQEILII